MPKDVNWKMFRDEFVCLSLVHFMDIKCQRDLLQVTRDDLDEMSVLANQALEVFGTCDGSARRRAGSWAIPTISADLIRAVVNVHQAGAHSVSPPFLIIEPRAVIGRLIHAGYNPGRPPQDIPIDKAMIRPFRAAQARDSNCSFSMLT